MTRRLAPCALLALGLALALDTPPAMSAPAERCVTAPPTPGGSPASAMLEPIDRHDARTRALRERAHRLVRELLAHPLIGPVERVRGKLAALGYDAGQPLERYVLAGRLDSEGRAGEVVRAAKLAGAVRAFLLRQSPTLALNGFMVAVSVARPFHRSSRGERRAEWNRPRSRSRR